MPTFAEAFKKAKRKSKNTMLEPTANDAVLALKEYFGLDSKLVEMLDLQSVSGNYHDMMHLIVAGVPELVASGMDLTSAFDKISKEKVDNLVWSKAEILLAVYEYVFLIEDSEAWIKPTLEETMQNKANLYMSKIFDYITGEYAENPDIKFSKIDSVYKMLKKDIENGCFRVPSEDEIEFHLKRARNIKEHMKKILYRNNNIEAKLLDKKLSDFVPTEKEFQLYDIKKTIVIER